MSCVDGLWGGQAAMNLFRMLLLAAGLAIFLIVRYLAASDSASPGREGPPAAAPKTAPAGSPEQTQPFPQRAPESAWV